MPEEDDAATHPVLQGEPGEVVIRGANVMRGYLDRPEETAETIVDGWLVVELAESLAGYVEEAGGAERNDRRAQDEPLRDRAEL